MLLWSPCPPEEAAVGLFVQAAFASLSNAGAAKDKDLRCAAIRTIVRCVKAFGQRVNAVTAAMGLLHQHEHSSGPMAELVATAWEAQEAALVSDVLREIGRIPMTELSRDTGAARNIATFLTELAELAPAVILMHMSVLNPHLQQGESYMMRNAILHAIGYTLVELVSIIRKERSDTAIKTRESLLQVTIPARMRLSTNRGSRSIVTRADSPRAGTGRERLHTEQGAAGVGIPVRARRHPNEGTACGGAARNRPPGRQIWPGSAGSGTRTPNLVEGGD